MNTRQYFVTKPDRSQEGPYGEEVLIAQYKTGEYSDETLVWCDGMETWETIKVRFPDTMSFEKDSFKSNLPPGMPPLPEYKQNTYYVNIAEGRKGPFSYYDLKSMRQRGELLGDNLVWEEGTNHWVKAEYVISSGSSSTFVKGMADSVAGWIGTEKISNFNAKHFFGDIFKKHAEVEVIDFFCIGGPNTTPPLDKITATWPSPWVFTRILLLSILLYFGFSWMMVEFENPKAIPGLMFAGNFAIPFSFLVLLAEFNISRDVPWFAIMKMLIGGGLISLIFASILLEQSNLIDAYWAGPIEEPAKLLAAVFMARKFYLNGRILTGLLCGGAVGAGFAIFESTGYVFEHLAVMIAGGYSNPDSVMIMRALLSPFCHIIWTAITAGALWRVMGNRGFSLNSFLRIKFLRIAVVPVILHMFWNSSMMVNGNLIYAKYAICGIIGWLLVLLLVNEGINQVRNKQKAFLNSEDNDIIMDGSVMETTAGKRSQIKEISQPITMVSREVITSGINQSSAVIPTKYHLVHPNGAQDGPFSEKELYQLYNSGHLLVNSQIWTQGWETWKLCKDVFPWFFEKIMETLPLAPFGQVAVNTNNIPEYKFYKNPDPAKCMTFLSWCIMIFAVLSYVSIGFISLSSEPVFEFVFILSLMIGGYLSYVKVYMAWVVLQDVPVRFGEKIPTPREAINYMFIPFFNIYWIFIVLGRIPKLGNRLLQTKYFIKEWPFVACAGTIMFIPILFLFPIFGCLSVYQIDKLLFVYKFKKLKNETNNKDNI